MREYSVCIDMFALLYSKLAINVDMVHRDVIDQYNNVLKRKMMVYGKEYTTVRTEYFDEPQVVFNSLNDVNGNNYSVLSPRYVGGENLEEIWKQHLTYQNTDLIDMSMDLELLAILGISEPEKIWDFFAKINFLLPSDVILKRQLLKH